mgnify:CR=1 FL=1
MDARIKKWIAPAAIALIAAAAYFAWNASRDSGPGAGFVQGNGRIEATEIDIATKLPGRLAEVLAAEGDFVQAGTALALVEVAGLQELCREGVPLYETAALRLTPVYTLGALL